MKGWLGLTLHPKYCPGFSLGKMWKQEEETATGPYWGGEEGRGNELQANLQGAREHQPYSL